MSDRPGRTWVTPTLSIDPVVSGSVDPDHYVERIENGERVVVPTAACAYRVLLRLGLTPPEAMGRLVFWGTGEVLPQRVLNSPS